MHSVKLYLLLLGFFLVISCKKEDSTPNYGPIPPLMTATVDGDLWQSENNLTKVTISDSTYLTGTANDASVIKIIINDQIITPGTYTFSSWLGHSAEYKSHLNDTNFWSTNHSMTSGTLEITHVSTTTNKMSGTFSFKAFNPSDNSFIEITDGKLSNVTIQIINNPAPVPCDFYFKVNNVAFNASILTIDLTIPGDWTISAGDMHGGKGIAIVMPSTISLGTHAFGPQGSGKPYGAFYYGFANIAESINGTLKITKKNFTTDEFAGTFNFTAKDPSTGITFQITDGCFDFD